MRPVPPFSVPLRLELNLTGDGLRFVFHARGLKNVLLDARAILSAHIVENIPANFRCYQATI